MHGTLACFLCVCCRGGRGWAVIGYVTVVSQLCHCALTAVEKQEADGRLLSSKVVGHVCKWRDGCCMACIWPVLWSKVEAFFRVMRFCYVRFGRDTCVDALFASAGLNRHNSPKGVTTSYLNPPNPISAIISGSTSSSSSPSSPSSCFCEMMWMCWLCYVQGPLTPHHPTRRLASRASCLARSSSSACRLTAASNPSGVYVSPDPPACFFFFSSSNVCRTCVFVVVVAPYSVLYIGCYSNNNNNNNTYRLPHPITIIPHPPSHALPPCSSPVPYYGTCR